MTITIDFETCRRAFVAASDRFVATVQELVGSGIDQNRPALGDWRVRDLIGHTSRALTTIESYLGDTGSAPGALLDTAGYYRAIGVNHADPRAVAERGRQTGRDLGDDLAGAVTEIAQRVLPLVAVQRPTAVVTTPFGALTLADYLPTRVFELAVHTADLRSAGGLAGTAPGQVATVELAVLGLLVTHSSPGSADALARGLTGRDRLPDGFSLLDSSSPTSY